MQATKTTESEATKTTVNQLKETYGKTPKSTNIVEMKLRVEMLIDQLDTIDLTDYPKMKAAHKVKWNKEFPRRNYEGLDRYANVSERALRKAPVNTLEGITNLIDHNIEWLIREQKREEIRTRSAKEWRLLERAYITKSRYTITDIYDDYKKLIENKEATWSDYTEERKKWRTCKNKWCLNIFPVDRAHFKADDPYFQHVYRKAKNKHSKFCCDECRCEFDKALSQWEKTKKIYDNPTFLPQREINKELRLETSIQDIILSHEISYQPIDLEAIESGAMKSPQSFKVKDSEFWWGECETYNISDLTSEEICEKDLEKYAKKRSDFMLLVR